MSTLLVCFQLQLKVIPFKAVYDLGLSYQRDYLFPAIISLTWIIKVDLLWFLLIEQCH